MLDIELSKAKKKKILTDYYKYYFEDEYKILSNSLRDPDMVFVAGFEYELKKRGFEAEDDRFVIDLDNIFANITAEIDRKARKITLSTELYNPFTDEDDREKKYGKLIENVRNQFSDIFGDVPELHSSPEYCGDCPDESVEFVYVFDSEIQKVEDFIEGLQVISEKIA